VKNKCPHLWTLLNEKARRIPPKGIQDFVSGPLGTEGQRQLQLADARIAGLIARTSEAIVGGAYRRDLSGVDTEQKLAELLCEITLVEAAARISDSPPILRPKTGTRKQCDVKVTLAGYEVYGEVKRLADTWEGGVRSIAKSSPDSKPPDTTRPRAMDLFSKLKEVHTQPPSSSLSVLFLFHPSIWNTPVYIKQALFGDAAGLDESLAPPLHQDGLFALEEWRNVSACAHTRVNNDGTLSIVQVWRNPKANVVLPETVRERLAVAG